MEIKLTAGETQDPVHTATDPPNKQRRLQKTGTAPIQPNTQATAAPKTAMCLCTERKKTVGIIFKTQKWLFKNLLDLTIL